MSTVISADEAKANISANLKRILKDRGMPIRELVRRTGEPPNTVYRIVRGENEPGATLLARIAEALDVSIDRLMANPEKPKFS